MADEQDSLFLWSQLEVAMVHGAKGEAEWFVRITEEMVGLVAGGLDANTALARLVDGAKGRMIDLGMQLEEAERVAQADLVRYLKKNSSVGNSNS